MHRQTYSTPWLRWLFMAALLLTCVHAARAADEFLDPEVAFTLAAKAQGDRSVELSFTVAPGYYLYGEQFKIVATDATLGTPSRPPGKIKFDETFQKDVESYRGTVRILVPVERAGTRFRIIATNQGCADKGLCYPPMERAIDASLTGFGGDGKLRTYNVEQTLALLAGPAAATGTAVGVAQSGVARPPLKGLSSSDGAGLDAALQGGRFWSVVGVFFAAGLLLSLTPCVLPMLPILSSIIVGQGERVSRGRGLALAASYALGMAVVYTALGVAAGLAGEGLAAALQNPWVLGLFALGLVALALSMFGAYELQLPVAITGRLTQASNRLPAGRLAGVFAMGGVSALIVSPCVAAPLAGALVYLSQTRDAWLGGSALFSLAVGMSVPLLALGASAGTLLPRAGAWMDDIKRFFGLLLLGVALWTVQSLLPAALVLALWGVLAVGVAVLIGASTRTGAKPVASLWRRTLGAVLLVFGVLQLIGAASGGSDPLQPLAHLSTRLGGGSVAAGAPTFVAVRNVGELDAALRTAGRPVMLDFYADWCVSCKEMERYTYTDAAVRTRLAGALLLKADVTANNPEDRELLKRFQLFGPPGTLFFDTQGQEVVQARVIGFQNSARFLQTLAAAGL